jgi:hypothetical protein
VALSLLWWLAPAAGCGPSGSRDAVPVTMVRPDARSAGTGGRATPATGGSGGMIDVGPSAPGDIDNPVAEAGASDSAGPQIDPLAADAGGDAPEADAARAALGSACLAGGECDSGQCVDGVCCASVCGLPCQACDVAGHAGECTPVPTGSDPGDHCAPEPAMTCGLDGSCDGAGACRRHPAGTECVPGSCSGATEQAARTCDGNGTCQPGATRSCAPNLCMGSSCGTRCTGTAACQVGFYCNGGSCQLKRPTGQPCSGAAECASGQCANGVCCNSACTAPCFACNLAGAVGSCTAVPAGQDPGNHCQTDAPVTCRRDGACNGRGDCRLQAAGSECAAASCTGAAETLTRRCNGVGTCVAAASRSCGSFACGATACRTSCASPADCQPGFACGAGRCLPGGLLLYWRLDESDGPVTADSSGNGLSGTFTGGTGIPTPAPPTPASRFPNPRSRTFTRAGQQGVLLAAMPVTLKPTRQLTVAAWFRTTTLDVNAGGGTPSAELVSAGDNYLLRVRPADIEVSKRIGGDWVRCFGPVSGHLDGSWHHAATVIDGVTVKVYFDGVEKCSLANAQDLVYDRGNDLWVGRHGQTKAGFDFDGDIDDVRIYGRALPPGEVAALFQGAE